MSNLKLLSPITLKIDCKKGRCTVTCKQFDVFGVGETITEAFGDFMAFIEADYHAYAEEDENKLDKFAKELADLYRKTFAREEI